MASSSSAARSWKIFENLCLGEKTEAKRDHLLHFIRFLEEEKPLRDKTFQSELANRLKPLLTSTEHKWVAVCLLPHLIKNCDAETLLQNGIFWLRSLQQFLNSKPSPKLRDLTLRSISKILCLSIEFDDMSREIALGFIHPIITNLLALAKPDDENSESIISVFRDCIKFYPGPSGRFRSQIENICLCLIDSEVTLHQNAACACLAVLPRCGSSGEKGMKFAEFWSKYLKLILNTLTELWKDLNMTAETQRSKDTERTVFKMSKITEVEPEHSKLVSRRICTLLCVFEEMISHDFPNVVRIDLERILSLCCAFVERDIEFDAHSIDAVCINRSLPSIWQAVLSFLNALVVQVNSLLLPYENTILKIIIKVLLLHNLKEQLEFEKPFSKLRIQAYQVLNTWLSVVNPILSESIAKIVEQALDDIKPVTSKSKALKLQSSDKSKKISQVKKLQKDLTKEEMTGKKTDKYANSDIAFAALKFLENLVSTSGPMLSPNVILKIQEDAISTSFVIADSANQLTDMFPSPYGCSKCRMEVYKCVFQLFNLYHHELPTPMAMMLNIFSMGVTDPSMKVSTYCKGCLSLSDKVIRPSVPAMREYHIDAVSNSNQSVFQKQSATLAERYVFESFGNDADDTTRAERTEESATTEMNASLTIDIDNADKPIPDASQSASLINDQLEDVLLSNEPNQDMKIREDKEASIAKSDQHVHVSSSVESACWSDAELHQNDAKSSEEIDRGIEKRRFEIVEGKSSSVRENHQEKIVEVVEDEIHAKRPRVGSESVSNDDIDNEMENESEMDAVEVLEVSDADEEVSNAPERNAASKESIVIDSDEETDKMLKSFVVSFPDSE